MVQYQAIIMASILVGQGQLIFKSVGCHSQYFSWIMWLMHMFPCPIQRGPNPASGSGWGPITTITSSCTVPLLSGPHLFHLSACACPVFPCCSLPDAVSCLCPGTISPASPVFFPCYSCHGKLKHRSFPARLYRMFRPSFSSPLPDVLTQKYQENRPIWNHPFSFLVFSPHNRVLLP